MLEVIFFFLILLIPVVVIHELGHLLIAKLFKIGVTEFNLGVGYLLFSYPYGKTNYNLRLFPVGGSIKMIGEQKWDDVTPEEEPYSFSHAATWKKVGVVLAGPMTNLIAAVLILFALYSVPQNFIAESGPPSERETVARDNSIFKARVIVAKVSAGSLAEQLGLKIEDEITFINGTPVDLELLGRFYDLALPLQIEVRRGGEQLVFTVDTISPEHGGLGVGVRKVEAITSPIERTVKSMAYLTRFSLSSFSSVESMSGPIAIGKEAIKQFKEGGFFLLLALGGIFSLSLGLFNLLPIVPLDGGVTLFLILDRLTGNRLPFNFYRLCYSVGLTVIVLAMFAILKNDLF